MKVIVWSDDWLPVIGGLEKSLNSTCIALSEKSVPFIVLTREAKSNDLDFPYKIKFFKSKNFIGDSLSFILNSTGESCVIYIGRLFKGLEAEHLDAILKLPENFKLILRLPSTQHLKSTPKSLLKKISPKISAAICLNEECYKDTKKKLPRSEVILAYNHAIPISVKECTFESRKNYFWAGRYHHSKNVMNLVKGWSIFKSIRPQIDCELHLYGARPQNLRLYHEIASSSFLHSDIKIMGAFKQYNYSFIAKYKYLILPSYREGCPNVMVESFSASVPIIGSSIAGIKEHLTPDSNIKISRPFNKKSISQALIHSADLSKDEYISMCRLTKNIHAEKFAKEMFSDIIINHIEQ